MQASEIIDSFEQYVDDLTELSSTQELALLNKIYYKVSSELDWEILKSNASGTLANANTITVPTDFENFTANYQYTDNSYSTEINQKPVVIRLNAPTSTKIIQIINWSDREQYTNNDGWAYYSPATGLITFTYPQSVGATYSFDYKKTPAALTTSSSPVFPARFHPIFYHGMAVDDYVIQLFDKAKSYARENQAMYDSYLTDLKYWNMKLQMN